MIGGLAAVMLMLIALPAIAQEPIRIGSWAIAGSAMSINITAARPPIMARSSCGSCPSNGHSLLAFAGALCYWLRLHAPARPAGHRHHRYDVRSATLKSPGAWRLIPRP